MNSLLLIGLFYALIGVPVVKRLVTGWRPTFDRQFTPVDRALVQQAAFFVLVPISVALHELGHAIAVWSFGGRVIDFGFYLFAGFVSYREPFTATQQVIVAAAGTVVNVVLSAAALALVFGRRPPLRAAFNELLLQFALLSGANALIFYPVIDLVSGMNGDWRQMYSGDTPMVSLIIGVFHAALLGGAWFTWRQPAVRARVHQLTDLPATLERGPLGGIRRSGVARAAAAATPAGQRFTSAAARVQAGWTVPVETDLRQEEDRIVLMLGWHNGETARAILAVAYPAGQCDLIGVLLLDSRGIDPDRRLIRRLPALPTEDELTLVLRLAMETVEGWRPAVVTTS